MALKNLEVLPKTLEAITRQNISDHLIIPLSFPGPHPASKQIKIFLMSNLDILYTNRPEILC